MDISKFKKDIESVINRHSAESGSNTPDFILAGFLAGVLDVWNAAVTRREEWYGRGPEPAQPLEYTGHVKCLKCGRVHWMHAKCEPVSFVEAEKRAFAGLPQSLQKEIREFRGYADKLLAEELEKRTKPKFRLRDGGTYWTRNRQFCVDVINRGDNRFEGLFGSDVGAWYADGRMMGFRPGPYDLTEEVVQPVEVPKFDGKLVEWALDYIKAHHYKDVDIEHFDDVFTPHGVWLRELFAGWNEVTENGGKFSVRPCPQHRFDPCAKMFLKMKDLEQWKGSAMESSKEWDAVREAVGKHPSVTSGDNTAKAAARIIRESAAWHNAVRNTQELTDDALPRKA